MVKANRKSRRAAERKDHLPVNDNEPRLDLKALVPVKVSDAMTAFPARVLPLMPPWEAVPDEFKDDSLSSAVGRKWRQFQTTWFFSGLAGVEFGRVEGIDAEMALRHLQCIQGSFEPKHEHKKAAVAYLASLWFTDYSLPEKAP